MREFVLVDSGDGVVRLVRREGTGLPAVNAKPPAVAFDQGRNSRAKLGFVVLAMEQTVEADVFRLAPEGVGIHFSRMPMSNSVSFEALAGMAPQIADSAALLLPEDRLDVACYTCNSGTMVIGESEVVDTLAASGCRPRASTTVMTGVVRALDAVGARTISVAAPYHDEVNSVVRRFLAGHGFAIADYRSMDLTRNSDIDRVTPASIAEFARAADKPDSDAVFICCGALRALGSNRQVDDRDRTATPVYAAEGIARKGALAPTDIEIHKGEVVGFAGLLGSGRTELARLIVGADKPDAGSVRLKGAKASITSPVSGLAHHIAYSTENRRDDGIVGDLSIRENIMLAVQAQRGWLRRVPAREVDRLVKTYMERFSVRPNDPDRPIRLLSGGNQQKVLLGRWLATDPELLLLDEPTRGIDVGAKADIQETVAELAEGGMSVVFISSELEEVVRLSERIVIMKDHQKVGEVVNGPDVTAERIVSIIAADSDAAAEARADALADEVEGEQA